MFIILVSTINIAQCQRIKDIVDIQGIRGNPLTGIGLVIGLTGTGDSSLPAQRMLVKILKDEGMVVSTGDLSGNNIAIVMVTAHLEPFARLNSRIDVEVSSFQDAESLQGGTLLSTLLKGLDGEVYAVAQGAVSLAGWTASGDKASITKNHQAIGVIPGGATVEREEIATFIEYFANKRFITLNLRNVDFSTAGRIGKAINQIYPDCAAVIDAGTIRVKVPDKINQEGIADFIADITKPEIRVDIPAMVVINERTGTIVVGGSVGISSVAISQGSLTVKVRERSEVSQPNAMFSDAGNTEVTQVTDLYVNESEGILIPVPTIVTVSDLASTLNAIGATPSDLIAIFHALKEAGALQAELKIM